MPDSLTATLIGTAEATATVLSHTSAVTAWALRYFGSWWNAVDVPPDLDDADSCTRIVAEVSSYRFADLAAQVTAGPYQETVYASSPILLSCGDDGSVNALSPTEELAYRTDPGAGRVLIVGTNEQPVSTAAARLAREAVRGVLHSQGWTLLHASAVVRDGQCVLGFGGKGAGKTTAALLLARCCGWQLLANDRVFVRASHGGVQVLPWPSAAAIGLGLLDALGLYDVVRDRVRTGEQLHPTQDERVTAALRPGHRAPLYEPDGRELKAQVFPDQLHTWFGLTLAASGRAAALLFPAVIAGASAARAPQSRTLTDADFFSATTEDRYPDIFGLTCTDPALRDRAWVIARERLACLPHYAVTLGHDIADNIDVLYKTVISI